MKTSKLLALAIAGTLVTIASVASAIVYRPPTYQTFPPWHLGLSNDGQCMLGGFVSQWESCNGTAYEAVQFDSLAAPTFIQSFVGYLDCTSSNYTVAFSGLGSDTHPFFQDSSGYIQDLQTGFCITHTSAENEGVCGGWPFYGALQVMTVLEQTQNPAQMYAYWPAMGQNLVLDLEGDDATTGARLDVTNANGSGAQSWYWSGDELVLARAPSWCMTASSQEPGASIYLAPCGSQTYQYWSRVAPSQVVLYGTESCLEAPTVGVLPTAPGTYLQLATCNGALNQQFSTPY
jgi:hypothetical protein